MQTQSCGRSTDRGINYDRSVSCRFYRVYNWFMVWSDSGCGFRCKQGKRCALIKAAGKGIEMSFYGLSITDWSHDNKRTPLKGISFKNMEYASDLLKAEKQLARTSTVTYFCMTRLCEKNSYEESNYRTMMKSSVKQQKLCYCTAKELEKYEVDPKYDKAFKRDIASILRRCEHIYLIVRENIKLTRYWPYFETVGFDRLLDFTQKYSNDSSSVLDVILPEMHAWMKEHEVEIDAYMKKIQPEIDRKKAFLAKKDADAKAEKEAAKAAKKAEKEEAKQRAAYDKERKKKEAKWDREYEKMFK